MMGTTSFEQRLGMTASGQEIADFDWGNSNLGPISGWPRSLITLVSTVLACPTPMFLAWGPDLLAFFNDAYRPILGQRLQGAIGRPFEELWHDIWGEIAPLVARTLSGESVEMIDTRLDVRRKGVPDESWWTFSYSPVCDDDDAIAGMLCITRETTERVKSEKLSRDAAKRLQVALSAGDPIGSWDWDVANDCLTTDERFALIYRVDPERAARGTSVSEFLACIHPDDVPLVQAQIESTLRFGDDYFAEYRILGFNGEVQWVSAQGQAILDENGKCVRFPGVSFDITINKNVELSASVRADTSSGLRRLN
ncbi:PAS domain-containing protein [Novosphingobium sp. HR1a]|nr:PAS domain-containing protein [Novosphingobium sp. HR1a]